MTGWGLGDGSRQDIHDYPPCSSSDMLKTIFRHHFIPVLANPADVFLLCIEPY
jgi:hypothetical protein